MLGQSKESCDLDKPIAGDYFVIELMDKAYSCFPLSFEGRGPTESHGNRSK